MLNRKFQKTVAIMLLSITLASTRLMVTCNAEYGEHVYYGYAPPSTNIPNVDDLMGGTVINYSVPAGMTILDITGLKDNTDFEIWDIYANVMMSSGTINRLERKFIYIPAGSFFKVISSERIAVMLSGGSEVYSSGSSTSGGTSTFYPAVTGGFRGREFIFTAAPGTHGYAYSKDRVGYNFYLMALEEADWALSDAVEKWSTTEHTNQRATRTTILQSRKNHQAVHAGAGYDVVFHLTTSGDVMVSSCALGDFVAVPAITGGYVGKVFYAPIAVTYEEAGRTAAFIVLPLEEGKVTVYDIALNVIAERTFTSSDVANRNYWNHYLGIGRFNLIVQSTGNICFMVGQTEGTADMGFLGDDITFIGAKPNQEVRFYSPTMAVVFAPEDLTIQIDGGAPTTMSKEEFRLLESGVHSIIADKHVIVEILASGTSWNDWGSYLIEPLDVDVTFDVPIGFLEKEQEYTMYIAAAAIAVVIVAALFVLRLRRRSAALRR